MKKLLTIALVALSFSAFAQKQDTLKVKLNWVDQVGTQKEKSAEVKSRQVIKKDAESKGFTFLANVRSKKGLYAYFVR